MKRSISQKVGYVSRQVGLGSLEERLSKIREKYKIDVEECFDRLGRARSYSGRGQQNMADRLNIKVPAYSKIEGGKVNITIERLEEILSVMGIPIEAFFCLDIPFWFLTETSSNEKEVYYYKERLTELALSEQEESMKLLLRRQRNIKKRSISQKVGYKSRNLLGRL